MVDRPPVKIGATLPEGTQNGLDVIVPVALKNADVPVFLVAHAEVVATTHKVDTGVDWVTLRLVAVEAIPDGGKLDPDALTVSDVISLRRSARLSMAELDFAGAKAAEQAKLPALRDTLAEWRDGNGWTDDELAADVIDRIPGAADTAWRQDPRLLREYLLTIGALDDEPAGGLVEDAPASDGPLTPDNPDAALVDAKQADAVDAWTEGYPEGVQPVPAATFAEPAGQDADQ